MHKLQNILFFLAFLISLQIFTGCASLEPMRTSNASVGPSTNLEKELKTLPPPKEPIVAAVYSFRDQTGQYKISTTGSSFSTAVTQGATSILLKALEDSGWFIPIEREGLSDLLNERKIIRSSRENYLGADGKKLADLPPLLYAGIIFEGGIISYDSNVLTGGEGVKYLGLSASGQYHQDRVTVYLRAVSTQNGRVLKTVYATKTILSQEINLGIYKFVSIDELLQSEVGFTYNEPVGIAVTEAIQKAVESMVIEGVRGGLWQLSKPTDITKPVFVNYNKEQLDNANQDFLGRVEPEERGPISINFNLGAQIFSGDYSNAEWDRAAGFKIRYQNSRNIYLALCLGRGELSAMDAFKNDFDYLDLRAEYHLLDGFNIKPYVDFGVGIIYREESGISPYYPERSGTAFFSSLVWGAGIEYQVGKNVGLNFEVNNHYALSDKLDGLVNGKFNDFYWNGNLGINIYFTNK
jgi:curli production assembly/transport component CsgG